MGIFIFAWVPVNLEYQGPTLHEAIHPSPPQDDLAVAMVGKLLPKPELSIKFLKQIIVKKINEYKSSGTDS